MLHQREGYWEARREPTWARFVVSTGRESSIYEGVLGVRHDGDVNEGNGGIRITLGHVWGPYAVLELGTADAMELIELLAAAIGDAHGIAQPSIDKTGEPCTWACCKHKAGL